MQNRVWEKAHNGSRKHENTTLPAFGEESNKVEALSAMEDDLDLTNAHLSDEAFRTIPLPVSLTVGLTI